MSAGTRLRDAHVAIEPPCVLVVSEDPHFIERVRDLTLAERGRAVACLGPAASPCFLDESEYCPLASKSRTIIVDAPAGGSFRGCSGEIPAGSYAERVQRAHSDAYVLLIATPTFLGPTGEGIVVGDRDEALELLGLILSFQVADAGGPEP
jgi:hypothetical protein